jgi:hypothetical protein
VRQLSPVESGLCKRLKHAYLALASLDRTIVRQRVRHAWLRAGNTDAAFLRLRAAHHKQRSRILEVVVGDSMVSDHTAMADAAFDHFSLLIDTADPRASSIDLDAVDPRSFDLTSLEQPFTEEEVWNAICCLPKGKPPGLDRFSSEFLCASWGVIRLQRIYNFLLFHVIILSILGVLYALLCYFILFFGTNILI